MSYKETLLSPIKIGNLTAKNRFFMQAMECNDEEKMGILQNLLINVTKI